MYLSQYGLIYVMIYVRFTVHKNFTKTETGAGSYIDIIDYSYTTADINRMGLRDKGCGVL